MSKVNLSVTPQAEPSLRSLSVGVFSTNLHGSLTWANPAFCSIAGFDEAQVLGQHWLANVASVERDQLMDEWNSCLQQDRSFEMEFHLIHGTGKTRTTTPVVAQAAINRGPDGEATGLTGTVTALPKHRILEGQLLETFKRTSHATGPEFYQTLTKELALALEVSYCMIAECDEGAPSTLTICGMWNGTQFTKLFAYPIEGTPCQLALRDGQVFCPSQVQAQFPDDQPLVELEVEGYLGVRLEDSAGKAIGVLAILDCDELSDSKQNEDLLRIFATRAAAEMERNRRIQALEESEARFKTLFLDSPVPMAEQDFSAIPAFLEELHRRGAEDLRPWFEQHPEDLRECANKIRIRRMNTAMLKLIGEDADYELPEEGLVLKPHAQGPFAGEMIAVDAGLQSHEVETCLLNRDGQTVHVELKLLVVPSDGPPLSRVLVSMIDLTRRKAEEEERHALQSKMQQAQKLESLGILAGGIAHDFNNLLVGVLGNADLALETSPSDPELREMLLEVRSAAHHASDLSTQMLAYSGGGNFSVRAVDLATLVHETVHLLSSSISKKAELEISIQSELPTIDGDPSPIRQVVMNLVTNASEAIGETPGQLMVRLGQAHFERERLCNAYVDSELTAQEFVFIEVSDTGSGMDSEVLEKLFDPFYTTKFTGRGLGMAAVLGIIRSHGGAILIDTAVGTGSTFTVLFPLGKLPAGLTGGSTEPFTEEPSDGELILVVDDEEPVRSLVSRVLLRAGYDVLLAENGRDAVRTYRDHVASIQAVLLDMSMPQMDGAETSRQVYEINPDARILFSSGYEETDATRRVTHEGMHSFIQKPYKPRDLVRALRGVLH